MSRSLNASMAAISSGVAEPAVSSITETRYCILHHLLWFGVPSRAAAHPCNEHPRHDPTPPPGLLSRLSGTLAVNDPARRSHRWTPTPAVGAGATYHTVRRTSTFRLQASTPRRRA